MHSLLILLQEAFMVRGAKKDAAKECLLRLNLVIARVGCLLADMSETVLALISI